MKPLKAMAIFGTRPDAAKMCPLVKEMEACERIEARVCLTGQHREQLRQVIDVFGTRVDYSLDIMRPAQTLFTITADVLGGIEAPLREAAPDIALVHGDTTTSFAAALACFYLNTPVAHVEAGLRTHDPLSPYPEEMSRSLIARIACLHFAPTESNRENLLREGVHGDIFVTGNTSIDAFRTTLRDGHEFSDRELRRLQAAGALEGCRTVALTAHRRENLGRPHEQIFAAVRMLHDALPDTRFIYPIHLNPAVREPARRMLGDLPRVHLVEPLDILDMHNLIRRSRIVMTDSGGIQEEAPHLGVPTLVLRTETERPEGVAAGTLRVAGVETRGVFDAAMELLTDEDAHARMASAANPYGDGRASERIIGHLLDWQERAGL